jgi:hypothetical protein
MQYPVYFECERAAAYFDVLMQNIPYSNVPKTVKIQVSQYLRSGLEWWRANNFPDWNAVTGRDSQPLRDLLLADQPPSPEALHEVEEAILRV